MQRSKTLLSASLVACCALAVPGLAAGDTFVADLDGRQETPANASNASGHCVAILDDSETELTIDCTHNVSGAVAAHIHRAPPGTAGGVVFPFADPASPIEATWNLDAADVADLKVGMLYVNVHSPTFPGGEIRGQLRRQTAIDEQAVSFPLSGDQQPTPVTTDATGRCLAVLNGDESQLELTCVHDVENPIAAHIHMAPAGTNGGIVFPLNDGSSPIQATWDLTPDDVDALKAGNLYVNVHSTEHGGGELRGQIVGCFESEDSACLLGGRFRVQATWRDFDGHAGTATAVPRTDSSGELWFFSPDNFEVLLKMIDGCTNNDHFWVFAAATTNVEYTITVTDTQSPATMTYHNDLGVTSPAIIDINAFATCP